MLTSYDVRSEQTPRFPVARTPITKAFHTKNNDTVERQSVCSLLVFGEGSVPFSIFLFHISFFHFFTFSVFCPNAVHKQQHIFTTKAITHIYGKSKNNTPKQSKMAPVAGQTKVGYYHGQDFGTVYAEIMAVCQPFYELSPKQSCDSTIFAIPPRLEDGLNSSSGNDDMAHENPQDATNSCIARQQSPTGCCTNQGDDYTSS